MLQSLATLMIRCRSRLALECPKLASPTCWSPRSTISPPSSGGSARIPAKLPRLFLNRFKNNRGNFAGILAERSEEHTSELQSLAYLVCRLLLEKKKDIGLSIGSASRRVQV